jgi:hypothetical protein
LTQAQIESLDREKIGTLADPQYAKAIDVLKNEILKSQKFSSSSSGSVGQAQ